MVFIKCNYVNNGYKLFLYDGFFKSLTLNFFPKHQNNHLLYK